MRILNSESQSDPTLVLRLHDDEDQSDFLQAQDAKGNVIGGIDRYGRIYPRLARTDVVRTSSVGEAYIQFPKPLAYTPDAIVAVSTTELSLLLVTVFGVTNDGFWIKVWNVFNTEWFINDELSLSWITI